MLKNLYNMYISKKFIRMSSNEGYLPIDPTFPPDATSLMSTILFLIDLLL